jgi:3-oxoacyl-[acyl-carrier protein] reductase
MCALVIPFMKQNRSGRIINFSGGGDGPYPRFTAYASSKGAILRFTESLASELKEYNIYVNAIAPGAVNTTFLKEGLKAGPKKTGKDTFAKLLEQEKSGGVSPEKAANLILFLASDEAEGLTGKMISAIWDKWQDIPKHLKILNESDIWNMRRIKPKERGYDW